MGGLSPEQLDLGRQRRVIDLLLEVRILPSGRHGKAFRPELVEVVWRQD